MARALRHHDFPPEVFMRMFILISALMLPFTLHAQAARDANPRESQNTQGANTEAGAMDPATKARVRNEGSAGGIEGGWKTEEQKEGAAAGSSPGRPARSRAGVEDQGGGRAHNETSSDREEGRGARGAIR
jgi:hypothetical protein